LPRVTLRTGIAAPDGHEEVLTEYLCDWPDCPNIAVRVIGCIPALRALVAACEEHAAAPSTPK
jgi:hypothetical protein